MGIRGELYTTQVLLANRSYFFNVKENRTGDVFLQIVESKNGKEGVERDRHQIAVFEEDSRFKAQGGFARIDKVFAGRLEAIIRELNEYLYDDGGSAA